MLELRNYQTEAVNSLIVQTNKLIKLQNHRSKLVFKAPTGSGKTIVMAEFLNRYIQEAHQNLELPKREFAFIWIAPNKLHIQSYQKIRDYFKEIRTVRSLQFEDVTENQLLTNDVLFLNWQSISNDENIYIKDNEKNANLFNFIDNTRNNDIEIIVVLDEAHLFASKGQKANEFLLRLNAMVEIDVSATPLFNSDYKVVIHRQDVVESQMIKKGIILNPDVEPSKQVSQELDYYLLDEALKKRKLLAEKYNAEGTNINPLLLIQLPNDSASESLLDRVYRDIIIGGLKERNITVDNHKLAIWLSKEAINLEDIESPNNITEVLIFKQAIALGWDCPRASVLLIFRELKQESFTIQTVGRILRMAEQKHYFDNALNIGYVYTNLSKDIIQIVKDDMDYFLDQRAERIKNYSPLSLQSSHINKKIIRNRLNSKYKRILFETLENKIDVIKYEVGGKFEENIEKLKNHFIEIDINNIQIPIPKDIEILELKEEIIRVEIEHQAKFAKTQNELSILFKQFCWLNSGEFAKFDSAPILEGALIYMFEVYFNLYETTAIKIMLYPSNQQFFIDLINESFVIYIKFLEIMKKQTQRKVEKLSWDVPEFKIYNDKYTLYEAPAHVLNPTFLSKRSEGLFADSNVELEFIEYLEQHKDKLDWWYKNGVENKSDFSIDYINSKGETSLFYIDFIILFTNQTLGFFDTKSKGSDPEMVFKHNALIDYIAKINRIAIGGVIVKENGSWRYPSLKIENNYDVSNWAFFDIVKISK